MWNGSPVNSLMMGLLLLFMTPGMSTLGLGVLGLLDAVDGGDAGVVEAGEDLRFPLEPGEPIRVSREGVGEDLQGNVAPELRVGRAIDLPHAPLADEGGDVVVAAAVTDGQGH